jgi:stage V sporulation protein G
MGSGWCRESTDVPNTGSVCRHPGNERFLGCRATEDVRSFDITGGVSPMRDWIRSMKMFVDSVKLVDKKGLKAYMSLRIGEFVVDGLKVVEDDGHLLVVMPQKQAVDSCPRCDARNHILANFCERCGLNRESTRVRIGHKGRPFIYHDIFHPISAESRAELEAMVLAAYYDAIK